MSLNLQPLIAWSSWWSKEYMIKLTMIQFINILSILLSLSSEGHWVVPLCWNTHGGRLNIMMPSYQYRPWERLILIMRTPMPEKTVLILRQGPGICWPPYTSHHLGTRPSATTMLTWLWQQCHMDNIRKHRYSITFMEQAMFEKGREIADLVVYLSIVDGFVFQVSQR